MRNPRRESGVGRSREQIREHYRIEVELAERLRHASAEQRRHLYTEVYDELFRRVPHHPQLQRKRGTGSRVDWQLGLLSRFLTTGCGFLEIGAGDLDLSVAVAPRVATVYAVDVSPIVTERADLPANVERLICEGVSLPVEDGSVDVAYSNQLIEHLHPDDVRQHAANVHRALRPGGVYVCVTPSRLGGPWDISRHFDPVARGLHLQEYTARDLARLFAAAGFGRCRSYAGASGHYLPLPQPLSSALELSLACLPRGLSTALGRGPLRGVLGVKMAAWKPG